MVIGDFNIVLNGVDKIGGQVVARSSNGGLRRVINNYGLIDVGFVGHAFTWSNRRGGLANIQEQLDRLTGGLHSRRQQLPIYLQLSWIIDFCCFK